MTKEQGALLRALNNARRVRDDIGHLDNHLILTRSIQIASELVERLEHDLYLTGKKTNFRQGE